MATSRFRPALRLALSAIVLAAAPLLAHAEADELVRNALKLAESGQGKAAYDMLEPKETERAGDPDFDTVFGIAANESGEFTRAIFALERVLATQPQNARAKAELGRALFAVGDNKGARAMLTQSKQLNAPAEAQARIDQFLQAIDRVEAEGSSNWVMYTELTVGHDSNASTGSSSPTFAVPSLSLILPTPNPKNSAMFSSLTAGFSGRYVIDPRWSLISTGAIVGRFHDGGASQYDYGSVNLGLGVSYREERNEYTVAAVYDHYEGDTSRRDSTGITGEWTYRLDGFRQFNTYLQYARLSYSPLSFYDTNRTVVGTSFAQAFSNGMLGYAGVYVGKEDPVDSSQPSVGFDLYGMRLGGQMPLRGDLAAFTSLAYENRQYGGTGYPPFFAFKREDKQSSVSIGLVWTPIKTWRVTPLLSYTHNSSSIDPFNYDRTVLSVTARKQF